MFLVLGHLLLLGHEQDGHNFIHATEATCVYLAVINGTRLQKLLEHDAILTMLASRDADAMQFQSLPNGRMPQDVIRRRWLFNKPTPVSMPVLVTQLSYTGLNSASDSMYSIASGTFHTWFASTIIILS